ncbi:MAG: hypothetical protein D6820_15955 [Lentisphaerae bacterium]|nr:MAG: hypothetical protein D6820_15955 [Lentisphaerota bacterium]
MKAVRSTKRSFRSHTLFLLAIAVWTADGTDDAWLETNHRLKKTTEHIWTGHFSYCWETSGKPLLLTSPEEQAVKLRSRHFKLMVYNPQKRRGGKLIVELTGLEANKKATFEFLLNFKGWQPMICAYQIMHGTRPAACRSIRITASGLPAGHKLYFSGLNLNCSGGIWLSGASLMMPDSPYFREKYLESYRKLQELPPANDISEKEISDCRCLRQRVLATIGLTPPTEVHSCEFNRKRYSLLYIQAGYTGGN